MCLALSREASNFIEICIIFDPYIEKKRGISSPYKLGASNAFKMYAFKLVQA
jgi:hypothetical protein